MVKHPFLEQRFLDLKSNILVKVANKFLSLGGLSYYLFDQNYSTRVLIFNYYSLFANADFSADWRVDIYTKEGKLAGSKKGEFKKQELAVVELDDINPNSDCGLVLAHLNPTNSGKVFNKSYDTIFFTEHYHRKGIYGDVAHSLRWPTPTKHLYQITGHAFSIFPNMRPYVLIGNSCNRKAFFSKIYSKPKLEIVNHKGDKIKTELPLINPMGCYRADILKLFPNALEHFDGKPALLKVTGVNVARKPFFYQTRDTIVSSDHL